MKTLTIVWQRLVTTAGATCPRCGDTQAAIERALAKLDAALRPLGIHPLLETRELDAAAFQAQPSESNRIWIAGRPLEEWLGGEVGASRCCDACGDAECRTVEVGGTVFEAIPEDLIVRAALMAASRALADTGAAPAPTASCCEPRSRCC